MTFSGGTYGGCTATIVGRECNDCVTPESGRIRGVALVRVGWQFYNPTDPLEWLHGIATDQIIIIPMVTGDYNGGEVTTGDGFGAQVTRKTGRTHSGTFTEPYDPRNVAFWNSVSNGNNIWRIFLVTELYVMDSVVPATMLATDPVAVELTSSNVFSIAYSFSYSDMLTPHDKPAGIFDGCAILEQLYADYCLPCANPSGNTPVCPTDCAELGVNGAFKS